MGDVLAKWFACWTLSWEEVWLWDLARSLGCVIEQETYHFLSAPLSLSLSIQGSVVQSWVKITQGQCRIWIQIWKLKKHKSVLILFVYKLMIGSFKNNRENNPRKCFWTQEKETRVKFNPGLSANRPLNNWAQVYNYFLYCYACCLACLGCSWPHHSQSKVVCRNFFGSWPLKHWQIRIIHRQ